MADATARGIISQVIEKYDIRQILSTCARPAVPFVILPVLMIYLAAGTVAQRYMGLYDAQTLFFSSYIIWVGPLPLPGGAAVLAALTVSFLIKFLFFSTWQRNRAGTILSHLGVLVLLIGGLLTGLQAREGALAIPEGAASNIVSDFHARELAFIREGHTPVLIDFRKLSHKAMNLPGLPGARMEIMSKCRNCKIIERQTEDGYVYRDMARFMELSATKTELKDEDNLNGITFKITGAGDEFDGIYVAFDAMPRPVSIGQDDRKLDILMRRAERTLPFTVTLKDFKSENHLGTGMARTYSSQIILGDGALEWPALIEMNKPLRYKGYTLFQSSFVAPQDGPEITVLAVVENEAWLFPYVGTTLMATGLLLHLVIVLRRGRKTRP